MEEKLNSNLSIFICCKKKENYYKRLKASVVRTYRGNYVESLTKMNRERNLMKLGGSSAQP
jgi:hypothetical protein